MSQFLPETPAAPGDAAGIKPAADTSVSDQDLQLASRMVAALVARPQQLIGPLMGYIVDAMGISNLLLPIRQIVGYQAFVSTQVTAALDTSGSLSLGPAVSGTASGPALSGLVPGSYIILAGFDYSGMDAHSLTFSPGGLVVGDNPRTQLLTLTGTTITSTISGTGAGAGGSIFNCWLLALRYDN